MQNSQLVNSVKDHKREVPQLLTRYSSNSRMKLVSRILGVTILTFSFFSRNTQQQDLFLSYLFHKQTPKVVLNNLAALYLIDAKGLTNENFKSIFPWLKSKNIPQNDLFRYLWRISERSIKLS